MKKIKVVYDADKGLSQSADNNGGLGGTIHDIVTGAHVYPGLKIRRLNHE